MMKSISTEKITQILKKNSDLIINEIRKSRELYDLLRKAKSSPLTEEEKTKVKSQLIDVLKTIPALAIFALPAGAILLPILVKILPFNILPSSFAEEYSKSK